MCKHTTWLTVLALQVDALKMEAFVDSFILGMGLERSYTLLVINPKWSPSLPSYTYRIGFSEPELRLLHEQVDVDIFLRHMSAGYQQPFEPFDVWLS